jgi:hypothetical protein
MLATPVVAALGGCSPEKDKSNPTSTPVPQPAQRGTLKVILNGPFLVVINENRGIKAFLPHDDDGLHQLLFATAKGPVLHYEEESGQRQSFQFTLGDGDLNLDVDALPRHIDSGFNDFRLRAKPREEGIFVAVDLPMPELITFFPPPVPVQFLQPPPRLGMMPTNYVLEYRVRDSDKLNKLLMTTPAGPIAPLSCSELRSIYAHERQGMASGSEYSQRTHITAELDAWEKRSDRAFLIGVGLGPNKLPTQAAAHALNFFNNKLLSLFPKSPQREGLRLAAVDVKPCRPTRSAMTSPTLIPAVQRYPMPEPQLVPVAYVEDCRSGGLLVGP